MDIIKNLKAAATRILDGKPELDPKEVTAVLAASHESDAELDAKVAWLNAR